MQQTAQDYLLGLIQTSRATMTRIAETIPDSDSQACQHLLSHALWQDEVLTQQVTQAVSSQLGPSAALLLDSSAFNKKGDASAGVARQYNGNRGKVDNCQVGVFAALATEMHASPIGCKLYLSRDWIDDVARCDKAGIPESARVFKTQNQLALDLVRQTRAFGAAFRFVGGDGAFGHDGAFRQGLRQDGERFLLDVHSDLKVWLHEPELDLSQAKQGRPRKKPRWDTAQIAINAWAATQPASAWQRVTLREGEKLILSVDALTLPVWVQDEENGAPIRYRMVIRREVGDPSTLKYSLSNVPDSVSLRELVKMQGRRHRIEQSFREAKQECGMADYQVRKWQGWHRHMLLVSLAMLLVLELRLAYEEDLPWLSARDIIESLSALLPRIGTTIDALAMLMEQRHKLRQKAQENHYKRVYLLG